MKIGLGDQKNPASIDTPVEGGQAANKTLPKVGVPVTDEMMAGHTICPFMRTALKSGILQFDGKTAPVQQFKELFGGINGFGKVLHFFANRNHRPEGTPKGQFDALNLVGSKGDHPGDSKILNPETGFDAQRFEEFTRHAETHGGVRFMTPESFGKAIAEMLLKDPTSRIGKTDILFNNDMRNSAGEWGLLLEAFGRPIPGEKGKKGVTVDDMRLLFEKNEFPADWLQTIQDASATGWVKASFGLTSFGGIYGEAREALGDLRAMAKATRNITGATGNAFEGASTALGNGENLPPDSVKTSLQGAKNGVCPAMGGGGIAVNQRDVASLHS